MEKQSPLTPVQVQARWRLSLTLHSLRSLLARPWIARLLAGLVIVVVSGAAMREGLRMREWTWETTRPIRFGGDVNNGFNWGLRVVSLSREMRSSEATGPLSWRQFFDGYVEIYDLAWVEYRRDAGRLDYTPLRLLIMSVWAKSVAAQHPEVSSWRDECTPPVLWVNTACEIASAVGAFFLVRLWVRRSRRAELAALSGSADVQNNAIDPGHRGWICGLIAALLVWFNPAVILDAHGWPQWDAWCLPFFFWAALCCSIEWWFTAGALLLIGAMLKGQLLLVAPLFVLWPIFQGRPAAAMRGMLGFVVAAVVLAAPWLASSKTAWSWIGCVMLASLPAYPWPATRRAGSLGRWLGWSMRAASVALVIWPWLNRGEIRTVYIGVILAAMVVIIPRLIERRTLPHWYAALLCVALCIASGLFHGSLAWLELGFILPTDHYRAMSIGPIVNLPCLMQARFRWQIDDVLWAPTASWLKWIGPFTVQVGLRWVYALLLLACSIAAAIHSRRRDGRFLLTITAPWVLFFAILPQMHERYLVWAAAITALGVGISAGMTLLHVLVSAIATLQMLHSMVPRDQSALPQLWRLVRSLSPDWGWMVLLIAAIYLYGAIIWTRRPRLRPIVAVTNPLETVAAASPPGDQVPQTTNQSPEIPLPSTHLAQA